VDDGVLSNGGVVSDSNRIDISSEDDSVPNAGLRANGDLSNDGGVGGHVGVEEYFGL